MPIRPCTQALQSSASKSCSRSSVSASSGSACGPIRGAQAIDDFFSTHSATRAPLSSVGGGSFRKQIRLLEDIFLVADFLHYSFLY
jgi:hypothetical protein